MVEEPSHVKQLNLNQVCKIGLSFYMLWCSYITVDPKKWAGRKQNLLNSTTVPIESNQNVMVFIMF